MAVAGSATVLALTACGSGGPDADSGLDTEAGATVAVTHISRGRALEAQDSLVEAEVCYRKSIESARQAADSSTLALGLLALARLNITLELYHRALPDLREAMRLRRLYADLPPDSLAAMWLNLAQCGEGLKHFEAADSASDSALALCSRPADRKSELRGSILRTRGRILIRMNHEESAEPLLREALAHCAQQPHAIDAACIESRALLGWCLARMDRFTEAEPLLLFAYARMMETRSLDDKAVRTTAGHLADMYERWGKPDLSGHYQSVASPPPPEGDAGL